MVLDSICWNTFFQNFDVNPINKMFVGLNESIKKDKNLLIEILQENVLIFPFPERLSLFGIFLSLSSLRIIQQLEIDMRLETAPCLMVSNNAM